MGAGSERTAGTLEALEALRIRGYRIVATTPHRDNYDLETLPLDTGPPAIFFGAEKEGLSELLLDSADEYLRIPMRGFVESLNISVSAAVTLQRLGDRLRAGDGVGGASTGGAGASGSSTGGAGGGASAAGDVPWRLSSQRPAADPQPLAAEFGPQRGIDSGAGAARRVSYPAGELIAG